MANQSGVIATPHHLATGAGNRIFEKGGSAIDALIAAAAVLGVVYPHMTGLGGDSWSLIRTAGGETLALNGTGRHPAAADASSLASQFGGAMPQSGAQASPVPGAVSAWNEMHKIGGKLEWDVLLAEAILLAEEGAPVANALGRDLKDLWSELEQDAGLSKVFGRASGGPLETGALLLQPALAESLRSIAASGPEALYRGTLAEKLVGGMQALGSTVSHEDFQRQQSAVVSPISGHYRGHLISTAPPNSQGFTLLQMLAAMSQADFDFDDSNSSVPLAYLFALANEQRDRFLADPETGTVDIEALLASERIQYLLHQVRQGHSGAAEKKPRANGDTVGIAATDASGLTVSSLHSIFYAFGARVLEPQTGIILQNRSASFSLKPGHPAYLRPGFRPPSTLLPVLIDHPDGKLTTIASMGGRSQAQIQAQLINHIVKGKYPDFAVAQPRFVVGTFGPNLEEACVLEPGLPFRAGHVESNTDFLILNQQTHDDRCGHAQIVQSDGTAFLTGTDPRADGLGPTQ